MAQTNVSPINLGESYSGIIAPDQYNQLMSKQHLYIHIADEYIAQAISKKVTPEQRAEIVEVGCGPGRILPIIYHKNQGINLTGIDADPVFVEYAKKKLKEIPINIYTSRVEDYTHPTKVDIFYSQGFHHHIPRGKPLQTYLRKLHQQLKSNGYYIVGDEFIAEYYNNQEREINLVLWYSHIISHAFRNEYFYLAQEEAKTLLDDIYEGHIHKPYKNKEQITFTLKQANIIDRLTREGELSKARALAEEFLFKLESLYSLEKSNNKAIDLSRGDYKICHSVFCREVETAGFVIESSRAFGPIHTIGGMVVYVLKKID